MKYTRADVAGVTIVDIEPHRDNRGFFSRSFCANEFAEWGLVSPVAQAAIAYNYARGTVWGLHRQVWPHPLATLVRCTRGAIGGVAVDVRPQSHTYQKHVMVQLSADNHRALYLPPYVARVFSDADGQHRSPLSAQWLLVADQRAGVPLERPGIGHRVAADGHGLLRKGRQLAVVGTGWCVICEMDQAYPKRLDRGVNLPRSGRALAVLSMAYKSHDMVKKCLGSVAERAGSWQNAATLPSAGRRSFDRMRKDYTLVAMTGVCLDTVSALP